MFDPETFLTELYVRVDILCKAQPPAPVRPGPAPALSPSEVVTLALFGQWARFGSETAYHGEVWRRLRPLFPTLPSRPQFNRAVRAHHATIAAVALALGAELAVDDRAFEVVDGTGLVTRNAKRRGAGWLWGQADIGRCTRLGWYEGVRLLVTTTPDGAITGGGSGRPRPTTGPWPTRSSPPGPSHTRGCPALASRRAIATSRIWASAAWPAIGVGKPTPRSSSAPRKPGASGPGPSRGSGGWPGSARSSSR